MAIRADITNFRILRDAHLHDDKSMSLIVGLNESGKSSLIGAMQYALTKSAFNHRGKDTARLITHGEERMHVRVNVGNLSINQTQSTGDTLTGIANQLSVPTDVLPVMFNSKMCGDGGNKALKTFLDGTAASKFDAVNHFANDPDISACLALARRAGKSTTKQYVEYFESMRAASKEPAVPITPSLVRPSAADLKQCQDTIQPVAMNVQNSSAAVSDLTRTMNELAFIKQYLERLAAYEAAMATYSGTDTKAAERAKNTRIAIINPLTFDAAAAVLEGEPLEQDIKLLAANLRQRIADAKTYLGLNPAPSAAPVAPQLDAQYQAMFTELGSAATIESLDAFLVEARAAVDNAKRESETAKAEYDRLNQIRDSLLLREGQWQAYDNAVPQYEMGKAKANADWKRWDFAAKSVAAAENDHVNKAGDSFGKMVSEFSEYLLQGRSVIINRDQGISLGGVNIEDCTESTRWRIEICIMAAIARTLGSPLLLIDAADILDEQNKANLVDFLLKRIVPFFSHVIVTATCRGRLEDEKPSTLEDVTKWTLRSGILTQLK